MALINDEGELKIAREAGKRLAFVVSEVAKSVRPGVMTKDLDLKARMLIESYGDTPAFLGYRPAGAPYPFPATICVSVNEEVVHGIPGEKILQEGDIVGIDVGLCHRGFVVDMAVTVPVGKISQELKQLIYATQESLTAGIKAAHVGSRVGAIGAAVMAVAERYGYSVVRELGGHGVGRAVHEPPYIPNIGRPDEGIMLKKGMVLALEPMLNMGKAEVNLCHDGYTFVTADHSPSAHFEHTILLTEHGPEILTVT